MKLILIELKGSSVYDVESHNIDCKKKSTTFKLKYLQTRFISYIIYELYPWQIKKKIP